MSENSSDSDSSCGWTVINHEGSDIEAIASEYEEGTGSPVEVDSEEASSPLPESDLRDQPVDLPASTAESGQVDASATASQGVSAPESLQSVPEGEQGKPSEEGSCVGAASDDSDIVTLEVPRMEGTESPEEPPPVGEEAPVSEDSHMGSSFSSQYAFCQPETVFPPPPSAEESSSDETSACTGPALRRRRVKRRAVSSSESEDTPPCEQEVGDGPARPRRQPFGSGLNRCVVLALVVAVSMGFGHFYGTVQIQKRQQLVDKSHEDELKDVKRHLLQCQQEQGSKRECASLKEGLATCLLATEKEQKSFRSQKHQLASENLHLREALEREESALALLQEELRKLRDQLRWLEENGPSPEPPLPSEAQRLKAHLEEEQRRMQSFVKQKQTLLAEAQMLRRELEKERQLTVALREELDRLGAEQAPPGAGGPSQENPEIEVLRARLAELEKKLSFEQQRSDLWEKLYVEAKDHAEKREWAERAQRPAKRKPKATLFGSVKDTFDAMKNSTKEFVKHHKEKIKRAKEAVKENLRKFSDSVKSTFRHFKDSTRSIFEDRQKQRYGDKRHEAKRKGKAAPPRADRGCDAAPAAPKGFRHAGRPREAPPPECSRGPSCGRKAHPAPKGCAGIFDCAHQEFVSLFDKVLDPIRADEFNQLMHKYLQQQVHDFHHWRELEVFVNRFFRNGVFIHDQMLFSDFVSDIKDYLDGLKDYQSSSSSGAFADLDRYIYRYYFHYDPLPQHGPSPAARKGPSAHPQWSQQDRQFLRQQQQQQHHKREGRWHRDGRASGRHMASLEIEVGPMPFDPKY